MRWVRGWLLLHCVFVVNDAVTAQIEMADPPQLIIAAVPADGETGVSIELRGTVGEYAVLASPDLGNTWHHWTNVFVLGGGGTSLVMPMESTDALYIRAERLDPTYDVVIQTLGSSFEPEVYCEGVEPASVLWNWSDGTTSLATGYSTLVASKVFDSAEARIQRLTVEPSQVLTKINLGFDGADGGELTPLDHRPAQQVGAVLFSRPLTGLQIWASSYNPITNTLDFTGFTSLEYIEAYKCTQLRQAVVTNLPALRRLCLEACDLQELDISGNPNLEDVRAALNGFTNIVIGGDTGPKIWHFCVRDNPQVTQRFQDFMTNFYSLEEFFAWNDNQEGDIALVSTNLTLVWAYENRYTFADFTGNANLRSCRLHENQLTNIVLTGCVALREVDLHANQLTTDVIDRLLGELDTSSPGLRFLDLTDNAEPPSAIGYGHYTNLLSRGVTVLLDLPEENDGRINEPGGTNAITFVTTSQNPSLEIRTEGVPESIVWHWGDGTITKDVHLASRRFESEGVYTNYVEVIPPESVTYFGAPRNSPGQGIQGVYGASHFPNLDFLHLYTENLTELSLAGCANLRQLHLARTLISTEACDQWFIDLDQAVVGPVTGADFYYPADRRSAASDAAWSSLVGKGFEMHPFSR